MMCAITAWRVEASPLAIIRISRARRCALFQAFRKRFLMSLIECEVFPLHHKGWGRFQPANARLRARDSHTVASRHWVAQHADSFDLHFHHVAGHELPR